MKKSEKVWLPSTSESFIKDFSESEDFHIKFDSDKIDVSNENLKYKLTPLESIACAGVLQEAAYQLSILSDIHSTPTNGNDSYWQRFKKVSVKNFDVETMEEPYEKALQYQIYIKFQKDVSFIRKLLQDSVHSLLTKNAFKYLIDQLDEYGKKLKQEDQLLETTTNSQIKMKELKFLLKSEEKQFLSEIETRSKSLGALKDEYEDLLVENNFKLNYIERWENSQIEQNRAKLKREEEEVLRKINENNLKIEREYRIFAEIAAFITQSRKDLEDKMQTWINNYNHEVAIRDAQIQELNTKRKRQLDKLQDLLKLYEQRRMEMNDYLELKEKRKQEAELLRKMNQSSTKIQAWWKGVMVRKGIGLFSGKKRGKDKDGRKKGKK